MAQLAPLLLGAEGTSVRLGVLRPSEMAGYYPPPPLYPRSEGATPSPFGQSLNTHNIRVHGRGAAGRRAPLSAWGLLRPSKMAGYYPAHRKECINRIQNK